MKNLYWLFLLVLTIAACKKETVYEDVIIPDNVAPPDTGVSTTIKNNYVSKVYIVLLGRKPNENEKTSGLVILNQSNISVSNRKQFIDVVLAKPEYKPRWYEIARADLLNNLDTTEITTFITLFKSLILLPQYAGQVAFLQSEIDKLTLLQQIPAQLNNNSIDIFELYKRCINNYFYDQLNMGTENFVVSNFQHFFGRYPTQDELERAKKMVDGLSSSLFFKPGSTKAEYLNIFFTSDNFYEGQVHDLFQRYMFRKPTTEESAAQTAFFKSNLSYQELQKNILSTDEYVGIKK